MAALGRIMGETICVVASIGIDPYQASHWRQKNDALLTWINVAPCRRWQSAFRTGRGRPWRVAERLGLAPNGAVKEKVVT